MRGKLKRSWLKSIYSTVIITFSQNSLLPESLFWLSKKQLFSGRSWDPLPACHKVNAKEMLPIIDTPVIQYVVEEAIASGIEDIIIITGRGKRAIEDYFDDSPELECTCEEAQYWLLKLVRDVSSLWIFIISARKSQMGLEMQSSGQKNTLGMSLLPSFSGMISLWMISPALPSSLKILKNMEDHSRSEEVPYEKLSSYGIIKGNLLMILSMYWRILSKNITEEAPSNIGAIGRYVFTLKYWLHKGCRTELEAKSSLLTGSEPWIGLRWYMPAGSKEKIRYGWPAWVVKSIVDFALKNENLREDILEYIGEILAAEKDIAKK